MFYRILSAIIIFLIVPFSWALNTSDAKVEQILQSFLKDTQAPGVAVAVSKNGHTQIYVKGVANQQSKTPVTSKTIFEIGSITKVMTAILFAQDVIEHNLQLTDNISQHLPELSQNYILRRITLEQLATHTSSLPFLFPQSITTLPAAKQFLLKWRGDENGKPTWQYSNIGIGVLGMVLTAIHHQDINELYLKRILLPLHMSAIGIQVPKSLQTDYAQGYTKDGKPAEKIMGLLPAAGSMKFTINDAVQFLNASLGSTDTPSSLRQAIQFSQIPRVKVGNMEQALGWQIQANTDPNFLINNTHVLDIKPQPFEILPKSAQQFKPDVLIEKTGGTDGFRAYIAVIPKQKIGVVILTNRFVDEHDIVLAARKILVKS